MRDTLINAYLDYRNNYLTIEKYADHNGLLVAEAYVLINLARTVFNHNHPES